MLAVILVSLEAFQGALARLLTDSKAREQFLGQPAETGEAWHLTLEEIHSLQQLASQEIPDFARALLAKRRGEAGELIPQTRRLLGTRYRDEFAKHAAQFTPCGSQKPREDALAFAQWLQKQTHVEKDLRETARYEAFLLRAATGACQFACFKRPMGRVFVFSAFYRIFEWPHSRS